MKYDLKARDQRKVKLFAHRGEAVVFWISLGALIFLAIISLFRYFYLDKIVVEYNRLAGEAHPIVLQLREIKAQNDSLKTEQVNMSDSLRFMRKNLEQLKIKLKKIQQTKAKRSAPAVTKKAQQGVLVLPDY